MKNDEQMMKNDFAPQIRAFCVAFPSHEAMRWKMEVASERLEMSML